MDDRGPAWRVWVPALAAFLGAGVVLAAALAFATGAPQRRTSLLEAAAPRDSGALLALQAVSEKLAELERRVEALEGRGAAPPAADPARDAAAPPPPDDTADLDRVLATLANASGAERMLILRTLGTDRLWNADRVLPVLLEELRGLRRRSDSGERLRKTGIQSIDVILQEILRPRPRKSLIPELIELLQDPPGADNDYLSFAVTGLLDAWLSGTTEGRSNLPPYRKEWLAWWERGKGALVLKERR